MYSKKDLLKIYRESFSDSEEYVENFFKRYYSHRHTVCVFADGGIVSALYLLHLNTEFYGKQIPAPLIVGAATAKPQRGKGYFKRLIAKTVKKHADAEEPFLLLYPSDENIRGAYERMGFCNVSFVSEFVARYDGTDAEEKPATLEETLAIFNKSFCTMPIRQYRVKTEFRHLFERWKSENIVARTYERNGRKCYVAFNESEIEEAVGDLSVLNGVKDFDGKKFVDFFGSTQPYIMARVAAPKVLLKCVEYNKVYADLRFRIIDELCPQNDMVLRLGLMRGKPTVTHSVEYDFCVKVQDLVKLAFGGTVEDCPLNEVFPKNKAVFVNKY